MGWGGWLWMNQHYSPPYPNQPTQEDEGPEPGSYWQVGEGQKRARKAVETLTVVDHREGKEVRDCFGMGLGLWRRCVYLCVGGGAARPIPSSHSRRVCTWR